MVVLVQLEWMLSALEDRMLFNSNNNNNNKNIKFIYKAYSKTDCVIPSVLNNK